MNLIIEGLGDIAPDNQNNTATHDSYGSSVSQDKTKFKPNRIAIDPDVLIKASGMISVIIDSFHQKVVGQENLRTSLLVALLTGGHVLLESVPGLAKTTAAETMSSTVDASFKRIQCTPDLLPSDIIGTQIYNYSKGTFETKLGPVHANFVLLDEINRSSAKTQSAMLEAMQEKQTSVGGQVYPLPKPFVVLATQNPIEQEGTYELPEAQLDRFLLKEVLTYPSPDEEELILERFEEGLFDPGNRHPSVVNKKDIEILQEYVSRVYVDKSIKQYIVNLIGATRNPQDYIDKQLASYVQIGASPRGGLALLQVAKALAIIDGRDYVIPEDIQKLRYAILRHRLILNFEALADRIKPEVIIDAIFSVIQVP